MSQPDVNGDRSDAATTAWGDGGSEETQILSPQTGSHGQSPASGSTPAATPTYGDPAEPTQHLGSYGSPAAAPAGAPVTGPSPAVANQEPAGWAPYSDQPAYSSPPAVTSVYPQVAPGYAPVGPAPVYIPATAAAVTPPVAAAPEQTSNRVGPGFLCALAGIILTAGGLLLAGKYGIAAATELTRQSVVIKDSGLATVGALLLLAAVVLNGWSPWATVIPGIVLTGIGGWALYDSSATVTVSKWTNSVLTTNQLTVWHVSGVTLAIGLMMLAASAAAALARASGKRDGQILGRRQA